MEAYRGVPQYLYFGEEDANDTLPYDDAFGDAERKIIINVFDTEPVNENKPENSHILLERFEKAENYYEEKNIPAQFVTYENTGHEITPEIIEDVIEFFKNNTDDELNRI